MKTKTKKAANVPNLRFPGFEGEWEENMLEDVVTMISGGTPSMQCADYWSGDIPFVTAASMHDTVILRSHQHITLAGLKSGSKLLKKGNLLLLVRGSMLWKQIPICYNSVDVAFNQDIKGIIPNNKATSQFLLYWFQSKEAVLKNSVTATGIGAGKLASDELLALQLHLPQKTEQSKIEALLTLIDERIVTQNKIIEELKLLKSAIRYKLFENIHHFNPDTNHIKDVLEYEQPGRYIVESESYYLDSSLTPVLTANKMFILGYTNELNGIYSKGDCIIFDDFTMDMKFVNFPFKVKSSAIKILKPRSIINLRYAFEYLLFLNLAPVGHKRHYLSEIAALLIPVPKQEIQNKIATLFGQIENRINNEINFKRQLSKQKTYLMNNLFI